jgi:transposase
MVTGVISLTKEQHERLDIINKANAGFVTVVEAAEKLGVSERQVQRLKKEVRDNGPAALIHKNTNRTPAHALPEKTKKKILEIRGKPGYKDSNFSHFRELLETKHGISISYDALHNLLTGEGIKSPMTRRRFKPHRRRKRRPQAGSLVQTDASSHDWLGTGLRLALHGAIDDATGQITGLYLCSNECMLGYFEVIRRMVEVYGVPDAMYADRHTIFRSPNADKAKAVDAPPGIKANETQLGRALSELRVQIIAARSPQAKGRVERLWGTLQSRLPVEFAILGIDDIDAANEFLRSYIFAFNSEFAAEPEDCDSAFLPLEEGVVLDYVLCVKEERSLDSGHVFSYGGKRFQIDDAPYVGWLPPKAKITVMASPRIGIKAGYLKYVFDTKPAPIKKPAKEAPVHNAETRDPSVYRSENAWKPKGGLAWAPGLPTYREMQEIVHGIFTRPYANPKNGKQPCNAGSDTQTYLL